MSIKHKTFFAALRYGTVRDQVAAFAATVDIISHHRIRVHGLPITVWYKE